MTRLTAHFDGKVFVPDEPVDLPTNQKWILDVQAAEPSAEPEHGTAAYLAKHLKPMSDEDAEEMRRIINERFQPIDPDPDINLD